MTLRDKINQTITALSDELSTTQQELAALEAEFSDFLGKEEAVVADFIAKISKHL